MSVTTDKRKVNYIIACGYCLFVIIILFNEHLVDHPDSEQIKVGKTETDLHTSEKEQRRCHLAVNWARFFFDSAWVSRFTPQSSKSCGSTS